MMFLGLEIRDLRGGREQAAVGRPQFAALVAVAAVKHLCVRGGQHARDSPIDVDHKVFGSRVLLDCPQERLPFQAGGQGRSRLDATGHISDGHPRTPS